MLNLATKPARTPEQNIARINQPFVRSFFRRLIDGPENSAIMPTAEVKRFSDQLEVSLGEVRQPAYGEAARGQSRRPASRLRTNARELSVFKGFRDELAERSKVPALLRLNAHGDRQTNVEAQRAPSLLDSNHPDFKDWGAALKKDDKDKYLLPDPQQAEAQSKVRMAETIIRREDAHLRALAGDAVSGRPGAANFLEAEAMGTDAAVGGAEVLAEAAKDADPRQNDPSQGTAINVEASADQLRTTADLAHDRTQELVLEEEDTVDEDEERRRRDGGRSSLGL